MRKESREGRRIKKIGWKRNMKNIGMNEVFRGTMRSD